MLDSIVTISKKSSMTLQSVRANFQKWVGMRWTAISAAIIFSTIGLLYLMKGSNDSELHRNAMFDVKILPSALSEADLENLSPDSFSYLAMIDAGSSGCRVLVYRYGRFDNSNGALYIVPKHISMKVKPGLSSFANNPNDAGPSLSQLIEFLKEKIPPHLWATTPIWLKATAGLRIIEEGQSNAILESVREYLRNNSPFFFRPSYARIISGKEEGSFGWISYNYLKQIIGPRKNENDSKYPYAVVEMGGASSQVTQRIPNNHELSVISPVHIHTVSLGNEVLNLYSNSYLGYGSEQGREKLNQFLMGTNDVQFRDGGKINDPCLNSGYKRETAPNSVYEGARSSNHVVYGSSSSKFSMFPTQKDTSACYEVMAKFFNNDLKPSTLFAAADNCPEDVSKKPLSFACIHQPKFVTESLNFLVFENFYYSSSAANVLPANHPSAELSSTTKKKSEYPLVTSPLELKEAASEVCNLSFEEISKKYPVDGQPADVALKLCFTLSYSAAFLIHGLHLSEDKLITVQKEVKGAEIEWALGAAYKEASDFLKVSYLKHN